MRAYEYLLPSFKYIQTFLIKLNDPIDIHLFFKPIFYEAYDQIIFEIIQLTFA